MQLIRYWLCSVVLFLLFDELHAQLLPITPANFTSQITTLSNDALSWNVSLTWIDQSNNEDGFAILQQNLDGTFRLLGVVPSDSNSVAVTQAVTLGKSATFGIISYIVNPANPNELQFDQIITTSIQRAPDILTVPGSGGTVGKPLTGQFIRPSRTSSITSATLVNPPSWLSMNPSNGQLLGTPPAAGNFPLTVRVLYNDNWIQENTHMLRIRADAGAPLVSSSFPNITPKPGQEQRIQLRNYITDPDAESAVRVQTNLGAFDVILFTNTTPVTANNFLSYVHAGDYNDVLFHRSVANFVLQGGGFKNTVNDGWNAANNRGTIVNEPGIPNARGTVAMAKLGGQPNSASNQFFINLADNGTNLDAQNGGFTVFGRIAGDGMQLIDAIHALPRASYNITIGGNITPFVDVPVNATTAPATMDPQLLVKMQSITPTPTIQFQLSHNSQASVATAQIVNDELIIDALQPGATTLTLVATDLDGHATTETMNVTVNDDFSTWSIRQNLSPTANGLHQNPDGDALNNLLEYAFLQSPLSSSASLSPALGRAATWPSGETLTLQFPLRKFATDLRYIVEANPQLSGAWTEVWNSSQGLQHSQVADAADHPDHTMITIRDSIRIGTNSSRFLRLRVEKQP